MRGRASVSPTYWTLDQDPDLWAMDWNWNRPHGEEKQRQGMQRPLEQGTTDVDMVCVWWCSRLLHICNVSDCWAACDRCCLNCTGRGHGCRKSGCWRMGCAGWMGWGRPANRAVRERPMSILSSSKTRSYTTIDDTDLWPDTDITCFWPKLAKESHPSNTNRMVAVCFGQRTAFAQPSHKIRQRVHANWAIEIPNHLRACHTVEGALPKTVTHWVQVADIVFEGGNGAQLGSGMGWHKSGVTFTISFIVVFIQFSPCLTHKIIAFTIDTYFKCVFCHSMHVFTTPTTEIKTNVKIKFVSQRPWAVTTREIINLTQIRQSYLWIVVYLAITKGFQFTRCRFEGFVDCRKAGSFTTFIFLSKGTLCSNLVRLCRKFIKLEAL